MKYGRIPGVSCGASRIAQGLVMLREDREEECRELLDAVYESGINLFDGAHGYGGGQCDRVFGRWTLDRGLRGSVVLMDKCCHHHGTEQRVSPECVTSDLGDCLERLGFDSVDVLHLQG